MSNKAGARDTTGTKSSFGYGFQQNVSIEENCLKMLNSLKISEEKKSRSSSKFSKDLLFLLYGENTVRDNKHKLRSMTLDINHRDVHRAI